MPKRRRSEIEDLAHSTGDPAAVDSGEPPPTAAELEAGGGLALPPGWRYRERRAPPGQEGQPQPFVWADPKHHIFETIDRARAAIDRAKQRAIEGGGGGSGGGSGGGAEHALPSSSATVAPSSAAGSGGGRQEAPLSGGARAGGGRGARSRKHPRELCTYCGELLPFDPLDRSCRRATLITIHDGRPLCKRAGPSDVAG